MKARMFRNMRGISAVVEQPVPAPVGPRVHQCFIWVSSHDPEIYPLVFCVSVGFMIGAFSTVRHLMFDPDVNVNRDRRETPAWRRYKTEEGEAFSRNRHRFATLKPNPVNTSPDHALQQGTDETF